MAKKKKEWMKKTDSKWGRNLRQVQDMVDGSYKGKTIVSMHTEENVHANRKVGDKWFDAEGDQWEQMEGYRSKVNKLPSVGLGDKCSECEKIIVKPWDKEIYKFNDRCYHCQIDFEAELKGTRKFDEWKEAQDKRIKEGYVEKFEEENKELIEEISKLENPFDMKLANSLANANIEMEINKNKV
jgi:hypothetical protein